MCIICAVGQCSREEVYILCAVGHCSREEEMFTEQSYNYTMRSWIAFT